MAKIEEQKLDIYNYFISSFDIIYPSGEATKIAPSMVYKISKLDDFDNNFFPLFNIGFHLNVNDYYKILKEKTKVKFRIRLQKAKMDKFDTTSTKVIKQDVFNDIFTAYIEDSTPFYDEEIYKKSKDIRGTSKSVSPEDLSAKMDLYLFKEKDIDGSKKVINKVLGGLTLTDAVFDLYSSCGLASNFLMQKFENNSTFSEIIFPPLPMLGTLQFLQETYQNFYNGASTIFFDYDTKYMLKKQVGCAAWRSQEFKQTVFMVREAKSAQRQQISSIKNAEEKKFYISVTPDMVTIDKASITTDVLDASKVVIVDGKSGKTQTAESGLDKRGSGSTKVVFQDKPNNRIGKEVEANMKSKGMVITISCSNIDMDAIKPNKEFVIKFLDKQASGNLSGTYRLSSVSYHFTPNGSSGFNLTATLRLTK